VRARPQRCAEVRAKLAEIPGVAIHAAQDDGRMVVTVEDVPGVAAIDALRALQALDGVMDASLIYQYSDDEND
jgi:nitrate reductase NapD